MNDDINEIGELAGMVSDNDMFHVDAAAVAVMYGMKGNEQKALMYFEATHLPTETPIKIYLAINPGLLEGIGVEVDRVVGIFREKGAL